MPSCNGNPNVKMTGSKSSSHIAYVTLSTRGRPISFRQQKQHNHKQLRFLLNILFALMLLWLPSLINAANGVNNSAFSNPSTASIATPTVAVVPASPHTAALALPGAGSASSSILEQFTPNCSAVSHIFQSRGIDAAELPDKPRHEKVLRYCESPSVGTCCTYNMETKLAMQSRLQLEKHTKEQIIKMSSMLGSKAQKFNEVFSRLLHESKQDFHHMFTRTYGVIYQQNSYVFSDLFLEFEKFFARGGVDLMEIMDKFFNILFQKMFQVLNSQYKFDEKYLHCVSEHMKELKPFGDIPDKLSVQIKRSFVATRTYYQALATAADVAKKLINIRLNADCTAALTKMQHCGACKGYMDKPCTNYCVNVIKGCLHYFQEFESEWENFAIAMDKVAERLLGSFNIVNVVEPINIKISEAIMNFQDAGQDITNRVLSGCGRPTLGRSRRSVSPKFVINIPSKQTTIQNGNVDSNVIRKRATVQAHSIEQIELDILDIDASLDDAIVLREKRTADPVSRDHSAEEEPNTAASRLNDKNVNDGAVATSSSSGGIGVAGPVSIAGSGGNGNRRNQNRKKQQQIRKNEEDDYNGRDPILEKMVRDIRQRVKDSKRFWSNLPHQICSNDEISSSSDVDGMCWNGHTIDRYMHSVTTEHGSNPEFPGNPATTRQTAQVATHLYHLKNAINHLRNAHNGQDVNWNEQEEPYYGSGSGSGGGSDDDEDDEEGSGLGVDGGMNGAEFTPTHKSDHTDKPTLHINNVDDEDDEDVESRTGIVSQTARPKYTDSGKGVGNGVASGGTHGHETNVLDEDNDDHDNGVDEDDELSKSTNGNGSASGNVEKMSLRQALLVYLLPLYMAWFGGVCVDLL